MIDPSIRFAYSRPGDNSRSATTAMTGTRKDNPNSEIPKPGEYGRDVNGDWFGWTPNNLGANLSAHQVVEHEDGTITVSPSILVTAHDGTWHGYLKRGQWEEC